MTTVNDVQYTHKIYNNDPILLKSYIDKCVEITMKDSSSYHGILYTVDPVSESVVLIERENEKFHGKIIVGHSIEKIRVISNSDIALPQFFLTSSDQVAETVLNMKKMKIKKLFVDNRFSVIENNDILEIEGMLHIEPPYQLENCICTNPIILSRVQNIFSQIIM